MERKNVLVVDDDPGVLEVVRGLLEDRYEVRTAQDGRTALLLACARRPDLVLLDVHFPVGDGLETLGELTRFDPDLQVVMLTGDDGIETAWRALMGGARAYVTKPFENVQLLDAVSRIDAAPAPC